MIFAWKVWAHLLHAFVRSLAWLQDKNHAEFQDKNKIKQTNKKSRNRNNNYNNSNNNNTNTQSKN